MIETSVDAENGVSRAGLRWWLGALAAALAAFVVSSVGAPLTHVAPKIGYVFSFVCVLTSTLPS